MGQAIAELHLGRLPEAEAALSSAIQKYPEDVELIANTIVLNVLTGKDTTELTLYVPSAHFSFCIIEVQQLMVMLQASGIFATITCPPH